MAEALNASNDELVAVLKGQWVHRFGVNTLPDDQVLKSFSDSSLDDKSSKELLKEEIHPTSSQINVFSTNELKVSDMESPNIVEDKNTIVEDQDTVNNKISKSKQIETSTLNIKSNFEKEIPKLIPNPPRPKYNYLRKWLYR